ncbi:ABC transporter ATP-binding protein [Candidatus Bathyarchaeota archaeon]|nr:ABC transporter ATP-binding protein [Candidatus Bathyarchaeota archaeon]
MGELAKVTVENLTKRFGKVVAVNNLNLEVQDREFFVLVGPNGCGKTTLLKLIAGVLRPDSGNIYIDDVLVNDLKPSERGVRMVFQSYALYPHMKVYDERKYSNLTFALKIQKYLTDKIKNIVHQVAQEVGIERKLFDRRPDELSHGEKQKVAVGRAITIPPKVFLMDEPMSNIDPPSRVKMMKEIRRLHDELRTTTIYVTQNLTEGIALADRMAVMKDGTLQQVGTPDEIINHPVNEFVADFIKYYDYTAQLQTFRRI